MAKLKKIGQRWQRTLAQAAQVSGVGFLTGTDVCLQLQPAPPDTGVVFVRADQQPPACIPARIDNVIGTERRTTLGAGTHEVALVEHVLAALAGMRVDNCYVEVNAGEPPGLDGSAAGFVQAIRQAGIVLQSAARPIFSVQRPVVIQAAQASIALHPALGDEFKISYVLDYGTPSAISRQAHTQLVTPGSFANDLADCRTFLLDREAVELRRQGLGARTTTADLLVIGPHGPINNRFRHGNELVRHKILDIVGDLALLGHDLRGHLVACRSGHPLNIELARALSQTAGAVTQAA